MLGNDYEKKFIVMEENSFKALCVKNKWYSKNNSTDFNHITKVVKKYIRDKEMTTELIKSIIEDIIKNSNFNIDDTKSIRNSLLDICYTNSIFIKL